MVFLVLVCISLMTSDLEDLLECLWDGYIFFSFVQSLFKVFIKEADLWVSTQQSLPHSKISCTC